MPKFFNKNELVLLMLIILMFDVNGFCEVFVPYIVDSEKRDYILIGLSIISIIYSIYVFHTICYYREPPSVKYKTSDNHEEKSCNESVNETIKKNDQMINEMKLNCETGDINYGINLSEKIVLTIIPLIFITFIYTTIYKVDDGNKINSKNMRMLLSIPIILLACSILSFAHIYIPFYMK